jgi:hypothetical protein
VRLGGDAHIERGIFRHDERAASRTLNGFSMSVDEVFMQASCSEMRCSARESFQQCRAADFTHCKISPQPLQVKVSGYM